MAIYQAFNLIRSGQIDAAIVGGAQLNLFPTFSQVLKSWGTLSDDGKCKFMDYKADGFVRSESCCVLYIEKLSSAEREYAHLLNVEANNDGRDKRHFLNTSIRAFREHLKNCTLSSNGVVFVETHGTGTRIADDIEIRALAEAYGKERGRPNNKIQHRRMNSYFKSSLF